MTILYTNVPPLKVPSEGVTFQDFFDRQAKLADKIIIASGYASKNSLLYLDKTVRAAGVKNITVVLGMYYIEGCPESIYNTAVKLNEEWLCDGIGEIRVTKSMKYHGKVYAFYRAGSVFAAIIGSANVGAVVKEAGNLRQYELSAAFTDPEECSGVSDHINQVAKAPVSVSLSDAADITIIHEDNQKLVDVEGVTKVGRLDVESYKKAQTAISFDIPLKVPGMPGSSKDFMKSNINKCYAKGRLNSRTGVVTERGWWETEIIVSSSTTSRPDYPKDRPFFVVTDDGWLFKAHVSGDYNKNFESDIDLKILGYWLKGRLVASGLIDPVDSPAEDLKNIASDGADIYRNCRGVITYQKLVRYGRTSVSITKTTKKYEDADGTVLDVWVLSFLPENVK